MEINFSQVLTLFCALVLSLSFHEWAHAFTSNLRGDDTAKNLGRMTLNPIVHMDMVGTVILPLVGAVTGLPVIGWAKPVPVDVSKLRGRRFSQFLVASAGPLANLVLSFAAVVVLLLINPLTEASDKTSFFYPLLNLLQALVVINAFLAFFNLIPLPPLDGGAVLSQLLPVKWADKFERTVAPVGGFILLMMIISGGLWWLPKLAYGYIGICKGLLAAIL